MSGETLQGSDRLPVGQALRNGDYALTLYPNGHLVLSSENRGVERTWAPQLPGARLDGAEVGLAPDGSLIFIDGNGSVLASFTGPVSDVAMVDPSIELRGNGEIVAKSGGQVVGDPIFDATAARSVEFPLYHPWGETAGLRAAIDMAEQAIDAFADSLRSNSPQNAPNVTDMLTASGLRDSRNRSVLTDTYNRHLDEIGALKSILQNGDRGVASDASTVPDHTSAALEYTRNEVDSLREQLRAASVTVHAPGVHGPYTDTFTADNEIPPTVVARLLESIHMTIENVEARVDEVADIMNRLASSIIDYSPGDPSGSDGGYQPTPYAGPSAADGDQSVLQGSEDRGENEDHGEDESYVDEEYGRLYSDVLGSEAEVDSGVVDQDPAADLESLIHPGSAGMGWASPPAAGEAENVGRVAPASGRSATAEPGQSTALISMLAPVLLTMLGPILSAMLGLLAATTMNSSKERDRGESEKGTDAPVREPAPESTTALGNSHAQANMTPIAAPSAPPPAPAPSMMVDMHLDGEAQRVPRVVSQAVQKELSNPNGSDASQAYVGSIAASTPEHPWVRADTANLRTGDVVQWEKRSALIILADKGLRYIASGKLVPLDPHVPYDDGHGDYGNFQGFFHPAGLDVAGTSVSAADDQAADAVPRAARP
ncbi:hypothetical protein ACRS6B_19825 [Nocardia asteroides]